MLTGMAVGFGGQPFHSASAAQGGDHFKAQGPDRFQGGDDALFFPQDYENYAAAHPVQGSLALFSRCRYAPFNGNTSFYSAFGSNEVNTILGDTLFALAGNTFCYNPQNEANVAVNPTNSQNVVTSSNDYRFGFQSQVYYSTNGGSSWTDVILPGWDSYDPAGAGKGQFSLVDAGGDPVVAFAPDGTLYFSALVYSFAHSNYTPDGVAVAVSHNGGATWSAPVMVNYQSANNFFNDKEWIAAGPNGEVMVTWTRFNQGPHGAGYISSPIVASISHDYGQTWSDWGRVSDSAHPYNQGSQPIIAADGTLYVAYEGGTPSTSYQADAQILAKSTNGGASWTNTEGPQVYDSFNCYPTNVSQGRARLTFEQFRLNSFPSLALDPTTGTLAMTWSDDRATGCDPTDNVHHFTGVTQNQVFLVTSSNGGATWSAPNMITGSDTFDKAYPAVAANAGKIAVGYYTRSYSTTPQPVGDTSCTQAVINGTNPATITQTSTTSVCLDFAVRTSADNYASETRVTSQSSNPYILFSGSFVGDYNGMAMDSSGKWYAEWTDFRGKPGTTDPNQDINVGSGF